MWNVPNSVLHIYIYMIKLGGVEVGVVGGVDDCKQRGMYTRGVQKTRKITDELAPKLIPFLWGILRNILNFKFLGGQEVLLLVAQNIQRKF